MFYHSIFETDTAFMIISADRRLLPVLANGEKYGFKDEQDNQGLQDWISRQIATIEEVRATSDEPDPLALALWEDVDLWIQELVAPDPGDGDNEDPCGNVVMTQYGPLVQTAWGQNCPYNSLTPEEDCFDRCWNEFTLTGCVATAMAQIIRYHEHPATYDYGMLLDRYFTGHFGTPEALEVSEVMSDAGVSINMDYGCGSSGAYTSDVPSAFEDDFDFAYGGDYISNFKIYEIKGNIRQDLPVILDGCSQNEFGLDCHAWVCDGYREFNDGCYGYLFYHMNWGWNGWSDGWYVYNRWNPQNTNFVFTRNLNALVNINPN